MKKQREQENVRNLALNTLLKIEKEGAYSNLLVNQVLKTAKLPLTDKGLFTELVYGTLQRKSTLDEILSEYIQMNKTALWLLMLLRLSLYQVLFLDRVPEHAVVHESVEIAKQRSKGRLGSFVNGVLRNIIRNKEKILLVSGSFAKQLSFQTAHPLWMISYFKDNFGEEEAQKICESNLIPPKQTIRLNPLRTTRENLIRKMKEEGFTITPSDFLKECFINKQGNLALSQAFETGLFSIQDGSSMLVAYASDPKEGMKVLDCCGAPGGKTAHLAERMNGTGMVVSQDIHPHKVRLIQKNAKRLGLKNIVAQLGDAKCLTEQHPLKSFDIVLVDAPCSGLGVIRRKPEIKDEKTMEDLFRLQEIQQQILQSAAKLVKDGGRLIYSTCTIGAIENQNVIQHFLLQNPNFTRDLSLHARIPTGILNKRVQEEGELLILPHDFNSDGFYICALVKERIK